MDRLEVTFKLVNGDIVTKTVDSFGYPDADAAYGCYDQVSKKENGFYLLEDDKGAIHHIRENAVVDIVAKIYPPISPDEIVF